MSRLIDADKLKSEVRNAVPLNMDSVYTLINNQPTVNEWIPCSEKLPIQKDGRGIWVLTCATSGLIESNHFCNGRFYDADKRGYKIIAWQPLPSVWKGENNG
jgi:hypothetical protein